MVSQSRSFVVTQRRLLSLKPHHTCQGNHAQKETEQLPLALPVPLAVPLEPGPLPTEALTYTFAPLTTDVDALRELAPAATW